MEQNGDLKSTPSPAPTVSFLRRAVHRQIPVQYYNKSKITADEAMTSTPCSPRPLSPLPMSNSWYIGLLRWPDPVRRKSGTLEAALGMVFLKDGADITPLPGRRGCQPELQRMMMAPPVWPLSATVADVLFSLRHRSAKDAKPWATTTPPPGRTFTANGQKKQMKSFAANAASSERCETP